jgi:hypothetical protein
MTRTPTEIAAGLSRLEREWLTGWQGPAGAAFNAIGENMAQRGLTVSQTDWRLNGKGAAVRELLKGHDDDEA